MKTVRVPSFVCTLGLVLLLTTAVPGQKLMKPLPITEGLKVLNLPNFIPIDLSPDGQIVAYTLQDSSRKNETAESGSPSYDLSRTGVPRRVLYCDIWISDVRTGKATNLTQSKGSSWGPVWSPDGQRLAFYSDRSGAQSLWVWERASASLHQVSNAIVRVRSESKVVRWTPDSRKLVAMILPEGMTLREALRLAERPAPAENESSSNKEPGSTVALFKSTAVRNQADQNSEMAGQNNSLLNSYVVDLALIEVANGNIRRLQSRINAYSWWVSPDGANVAVEVAKGLAAQGSLQALWDLAVISLVDGRSRTLVADFGANNLTPINWSPDGKSLAYVTSGPQARNDCFIVSASGGKPRNLTRGEHPRFDRSSWRGAVWDAAGENLFLLTSTSLWRVNVAGETARAIGGIPRRTIVDIVGYREGRAWSPKGKDSVVLITRDEETKQEGMYRFDLTSGAYTKLGEGNQAYGSAPRFKVSASPEVLVYANQSADRSEDLWTTGSDLANPKQVTRINPIFDRYVMGESRMIEWQNEAGQQLRGALLLPAGYQEGKRYPVIVYQYPGSMWSNYRNLFGFNLFSSPAENWQFLATRGYAVLLPDVPANPETYMQDIARAVLPALDKLIELGIADPDRLGVTGQSNGGYGVLSLMVQTTRFKAAVDRAGTGNLISQYTQTSEDGSSLYMAEMVIRTGGSLWDKRDSFVKNSPIFYFDRVQTPLLIIQGTADTQVMQARSDEVFVSLRFLGKEVEYAKYAGESHGVAEWSNANQVDYLKRMIAWFDKYLKAPEKTEGSSQ